MEKDIIHRAIEIKKFSCYPGDTVTDPFALSDFLGALLTRIEHLESMVEKLQNQN